MSAKKLKKIISSAGLEFAGCVEKKDLVQIAIQAHAILATKAQEAEKSIIFNSFELNPGALSPEARGGATLAAVGQKIFLLGGANRLGNHYDDVFMYDIGVGKWSKCNPKGKGLPRVSGLTANVFGKMLIVCGGQNLHSEAGRDKNSTSAAIQIIRVLNTESMQWQPTAVGGTHPSPRNSHTATTYGSKLLMFGGSSAAEGPSNDLFALDLEDQEAMSWAKMCCRGDPPAPREMHAAVVTGSGDRALLHIFGGRLSDNSVTANVSHLNLGSPGNECFAPPNNKLWKYPHISYFFPGCFPDCPHFCCYHFIRWGFHGKYAPCSLHKMWGESHCSSPLPSLTMPGC